jgi:hypothetical protein
MATADHQNGRVPLTFMDLLAHPVAIADGMAAPVGVVLGSPQPEPCTAPIMPEKDKSTYLSLILL